MPVSGLLLTLGGSSAEQIGALQAIRARHEFMTGEICTRWLPVVMDARDDRESRALHDWVMTLPGVSFVDVVAVNFQTDSEQSEIAPVSC